MIIQRSLIGSSSSAIKSHNLRAVLLTLLRHEHVSRVRIAELTGLSTTTVTNLITELLEQEIVEEEGSEPIIHQRGVGRPRTALRFIPESRYAIGVHIGVGSVRIAITNLFAQPLREISFEHPLDQPAEQVLLQISNLVQQLIVESRVNARQIVGVGIGASGLVDPFNGINILAPNLGWRNIAIRDWLHIQLQLPVFVDNNVRAMAMAEALFGAGKDVHVLAFVYARIGVGAGFVLGGQLYRGGAGAGEIGHETIIPDNGDACRCGNRGCLETLVSEPVIVGLAQNIAEQERDGLLAEYLRQSDTPLIERIFDAARAGDHRTRVMLEERARYMGIALANLVNTLSPELIILGGILAQGEDILFPVIKETLQQRAFAGLGEHVQVLTPTFGQSAGVVGAAALAMDTFFFGQSEVTL